MKKWLSLLGTNRRACTSIMLEDGTLSGNFNLERGQPQSDNLSPITFNFYVQILIFKLELDNSILGIPNNIMERVCLPNLFL